MRHIVKRIALTVVTFIAVTAVPSVAAHAAPLINEVPCNRSDFLKIRVHTGSGWYRDICYANGGESTLPPNTWLHRIDSGNNRVQWYGDVRWQPSSPIAKNTIYTFPNTPGGVRIDLIRIV